MCAIVAQPSLQVAALIFALHGCSVPPSGPLLIGHVDELVFVELVVSEPQLRRRNGSRPAPIDH